MSRLNRASVIDAAMEILETGGSQALTIPALATKLKIRPPSLYNHIESIFELKRELSIRSMRLIADVRNRAFQGKSRDEAVLAIASSQRQFASEHPALYELSLAVPPENDKEWSEAFNEFRLLWMKALEGYELDPLEKRNVGRALRGAVHGFVD